MVSSHLAFGPPLVRATRVCRRAVGWWAAIAATVWMLGAAAAQAPGEPMTVTAVVPHAFPPQYSLDIDGHPAGFAIDVMTEVAKLANLRVKYLIVNSWAEVSETVRSGRADVIPNFGITEERKQQFAFTSPLETFNISVFVLKNTPGIETLADLRGHRVGVVRTNAGIDLISGREGVRLDIFPEFPSALYALLAGHVTAIAYPEPVAWKFATDAGLADRLEVLDERLAQIRRGMAVSPDNVALLTRLNAAVDEFVAGPEFGRVYSRWYGRRQTFWNATRISLASIGLVVFVGLAIILWRRWSVTRISAELETAGRGRAEAERRLHDAVNSLQEGFALFDADDRLLLANNAYRKLFPQNSDAIREGRLFEELLRNNVRRGMIVEAFGREEEFIRERMERHRNPGPAIVRNYTDGRCFLIRETRTPEGGIALAFVDITQLRETEEALRAREHLLRELLENLPVAVAEMDCLGTILYANPAYHLMLGFEPNEIVGTSTLDHLPEPDRSIQAADLEKLVRDQPKPTPRFRRNVTKQGELLDTEVHWDYRRDDHGNIMGFRAVVLDITERKRAELAVRETAARLAEAQSVAHIGSWEADLGTKKASWSDEQFRIFGHEPGAVVPSRQAFEDLLHPEDRDRIVSSLNDAIKSGSRWEVEFRIIRPDGTIRHLHTRTIVRRNSAGRPAAIFGTTVDISERKIAEERALELSIQLAHVSRVRTTGELAASFAHEVNQPLTTITTYAQGLRERLDADRISASEVGTVVGKICDQAKRANQIVRHIRWFLKQDLPERRSTDVGETIKEAITFLDAEFKKAGVAVNLEIQPSLPPIEADAVQIQQVIVNLAQNAIDAMSEGTDRQRRLSITASRGLNGNVEISVCDTGPGVSPEVRDRLFDPFFTTKTAGLGIGLNVCHSIVEDHGGRIWIDGDGASETAFRFSLPIARPKESHHE